MSCDIATRWDEVCAILRQRIPEVVFQTWFANVEVKTLGPDGLDLGVANAFYKKWIETKYLDDLKSAASQITGCEVPVSVFISPRLFSAMRRAQEQAKLDTVKTVAPLRVEDPTRPKWEFRLHSGYRLDNFVVASGNRLAHAAALRAAEKPGEYNPLFICGSHGTGKSHLLHAICRRAQEIGRAKNPMFWTVDRFLAEFTAAFAARKVQDFRNLFAHCGLLVVDDIHVLAQGNKAATQDEFLSVFDALAAAGAQIVLAADRAPGELTGLSAKLRGRLESGLVAKLEMPDAEARIALARAKAAERGMALPDSAAMIISHELSGDVRELEGVVQRLAALVELEGMAPDTACVRQALDASASLKPAKILRIEDIASSVAEESGLTVADLFGRGRSAPVRSARQLAMVLSRTLTGASLTELGRVFGGRSHATVLAAVKAFSTDIFQDELRSRPVERILLRLGCRTKPAKLLDKQGELFTR